MAPSGSAFATLAIFFLSIVFVIYPKSFPLTFPLLGRKRISIDLTSAPIIAILILWASQCLGPRQIRDGIVGTDGVQPYNILILFFSLAYMAITLDITGVLQAAAFWVSNKGGSNGYKLYLYFYIMLTVLSVFLGNDPVILSGTAFLVYYTKVQELNPISWLMSEFAAANTASMVLFVGNPTNVVICEGFRVNNAAFTAYTILPFLACIIACFLGLAVQFRKEKYIPRRLNVAGDLDVRSVLLDPIGAWVGSVILGTCLIVIIAVSFAHVEVWKISLPFAVAKFIYDLGWDHYRFMRRIPMLTQGQSKRSDEDLAQVGEVIVMEQLRRQHSPSGGGLPAPSQQGSAGMTHRVEKDRRGDTLDEIHDAKSAVEVETRVNARNNTTDTDKTFVEETGLPTKSKAESADAFERFHHFYNAKKHAFATHFPTFYTALPRLPFALVPFAFSQFILIEALAHQGWIQIFARWLVIASNNNSMYPVIWLIGVLGVVLCNISGTNIGATILLTKVVRAANMPEDSARAAAVALAVASNIGAVSFTFSASLAGLLWRQILEQKGIFVKQRTFALWNMLPLALMTGVGLGVVCAEMAVLYRR